MTTRAKATYEVRVDLDGNRQFTDASGDITAWVNEISDITIGMRKGGDRIGRSARLEMELDNSTGLFSPERGTALSGFTKGRAIRVRMTYNAVTVDLYNGRIDDIKPQTGAKGTRRTKIVCNGHWAELQKNEVTVGVQQAKRYDEIVAAILANLVIYPANVQGWFLGIAGFSELGVTSILGSGASDYCSLEAGVNVFNYAGDNWRDGVSVQRALVDVMLTEGGWLYEDVDGKLHGWMRHHLYVDLVNAVDATLTGADLSGADYAFGDTTLNAIEVSFNPREVSASSTDTLGTVDSAVLLPAGTATDVTVRFDDGSGNRISGLNVITPVASTDYAANAKADGSGADATSSVTCAMTANGDKAVLTFTNHAAVDAYLQAGARVRGKKLTDFGQQVVKAQDDTSIFNYGRFGNKLPLTMLDDRVYAQNLAQWVVDMYKNPAGNLEKVSFNAESSATLMALARDVRIGDRWQLSETQSGADGEYFVIGVERQIRPRRHRIDVILEPAPGNQFWVLGLTGYSELGQTTYLGL